MNRINIQEQRSNESFNAIKLAHKLSGNPGDIKQYYDQWSHTYDRDVDNEDYCGPDYIACFFDLLPKQWPGPETYRDATMKILDAGCGTGLVGTSLQRKGYLDIDGFDLSFEMIEKAKKRMPTDI